ncbi:hypothetical protein EJ03DRAFT_352168 [Teratosphaeria nubilosa]|uniref:Xylanolytic transcriptional activator regulatory domain-containing protein n=1 Tax=Teratosphaeria nubilosa TaxID=161662 RepID=A0A6G1L872_9PEZI|nr:hypothetical protein EJ03DRAFT_352168 [Teratosphaeria nubilosa]
MDGHLSGTWTPRDLFDFGSNANLAFDDIDLAFLNAYNQNDPFHVNTPTSLDTVMTANAAVDPTAHQDVGSDMPTSRKPRKSSIWRFRPTSVDNSYNNIALPGTKQSERLPAQRKVTLEQLGAVTRDEVLWIMMQARPDPRSLVSFPSAALLDSLLQFCLSSNVAPVAFVHIPTFKPSQKLGELCAMLVAAGAMAAPDATLHKLGLAIQEAVRFTLTNKVEKDNTLIRDLQCLQAYLISLDVGLWSGNSRKMELAESFLQPYATMIRRCGWFGAKCEATVLTSDDTGQVLQDKWHAWIEQESRKRMVYWLFEHDATMSIALSINMNMSYAELALPLPSPRKLWLASSAEKWKEAFLSDCYDNKSTSLVDLLRNIELLMDYRDMLDDEMAARALLSAAWGMIRPYKQLVAVSRHRSSAWNNGLLLSFRLSEMTQLLACIGMGIGESSRNKLLLELLSMHLHMSLEDVHSFAGMEDRLEAGRNFPALKEWMNTQGARQSIWHAGQVLRHAKELSPLKEFQAVAVYQASLTLWSYSVMSEASESSHSPHGSDLLGKNRKRINVHLDKAETPESRAFISFDRGLPVILSSSQDSKPLADTAGILAVSISILQARHSSSQARPLLVENLIGLLEGLQEVAL